MTTLDALGCVPCERCDETLGRRRRLAGIVREEHSRRVQPRAARRLRAQHAALADEYRCDRRAVRERPRRRERNEVSLHDLGVVECRVRRRPWPSR